MRTIIAGSRNITDYDAVLEAIKDSGFKITEVLCGGAPGPDMLGEMWALTRGIPRKYFPADWRGLGLKAGPIRNEQMAQNADALIAVWDGGSRGTGHMIGTARKYGLKVYVKIVNNPPVDSYAMSKSG